MQWINNNVDNKKIYHKFSILIKFKIQKNNKF